MWEHKKTESDPAETQHPLKDAVHEARIEAAERSGVVVDMRDADIARLELLNEALDPLFKEIPEDVELFDRGVSKGDVHGCGLTWSRMSRWVATNANTVSCKTHATDARC
jgi:hypothetical protein